MHMDDQNGQKLTHYFIS